MNFEDNYLRSAKLQFQYYKSQADKTFNQLDEQDIFWQPNDASNSIAIIVNHMAGNMLSRWTDFLTTDGEKTWRHRDTEFEDIIKSKAEMLTKWESGWTCLFTALDSINKNNFFTEIYIRNQKHTITEAVNRQLCHYALHIGQIIYIGKVRKATSWESLSIKKGASSAYNEQKFSKGKHGGHFTDEESD